MSICLSVSDCLSVHCTVHTVQYMSVCLYITVFLYTLQSVCLYLTACLSESDCLSACHCIVRQLRLDIFLICCPFSSCGYIFFLPLNYSTVQSYITGIIDFHISRIVILRQLYFKFPRLVTVNLFDILPNFSCPKLSL